MYGGDLFIRTVGRPSNRAYVAEFKAAMLARYQERYPDFCHWRRRSWHWMVWQWTIRRCALVNEGGLCGSES